MKRVTIRVPATTANLGPGFDAFGCALSLYTDVTFEETDSGLEITGCDEAYTGPDNLAYTAYCAVLGTLSEEVRGVKIHIDAHIPSAGVSAPPPRCWWPAPWAPTSCGAISSPPRVFSTSPTPWKAIRTIWPPLSWAA